MHPLLYNSYEILPVLDLVSPKHVTDCLKTMLKKREDNKRFYLLSMMVLIVTHMMATQAENSCQFLFTKGSIHYPPIH